jgi:DNA-directed RNA polymerase specialized sigma24 family protein
MPTRDHGGAGSTGPSRDVAAAAGGDESAWDRLFDRHAQRVWSTARGYGLGAAAAAGVCHLTWARLVEHLDELITDEQLREWLVAAAEHQARRAVCVSRSALH